jgi:hypothetical protein
MEIFRRNSKVVRFVIIKSNMTHTYLGHNIIAVQKQLMGIVSLIYEVSVTSTCVTDSTCCISKPILCQENNDVNHISEKILRNLDKLM